MSLRLIKTNKSLGEDLKNEPLLYSFLVVLIRHMALKINLKKVKKKKTVKHTMKLMMWLIHFVKIEFTFNFCFFSFKNYIAL